MLLSLPQQITSAVTPRLLVQWEGKLSLLFTWFGLSLRQARYHCISVILSLPHRGEISYDLGPGDFLPLPRCRGCFSFPFSKPWRILAHAIGFTALPSITQGYFAPQGVASRWTFYLSCSSDSSPYPELDHEECLLSFPTCPESSNFSCEHPAESYGEEPLSGCKSPLASLVSGVLYSHTCLHSIFSNF